MDEQDTYQMYNNDRWTVIHPSQRRRYLFRSLAIFCSGSLSCSLVGDQITLFLNHPSGSITECGFVEGHRLRLTTPEGCTFFIDTNTNRFFGVVDVGASFGITLNSGQRQRIQPLIAEIGRIKKEMEKNNIERERQMSLQKEIENNNIEHERQMLLYQHELGGRRLEKNLLKSLSCLELSERSVPVHQRRGGQANKLTPRASSNPNVSMTDVTDELKKLLLEHGFIEPGNFARKMSDGGLVSPHQEQKTRYNLRLRSEKSNKGGRPY